MPHPFPPRPTRLSSGRHRLVIVAGLLAASVGLLPSGAVASEPRTVAATVFGNDPCPKAQGDEIVVCAREPESERYRIPKRFRDKPDVSAAAQGWGARVATLDDVNRIGLPNSCSPVGSAGQTGCSLMAAQQWRAERNARAAEARSVP